MDTFDKLFNNCYCCPSNAWFRDNIFDFNFIIIFENLEADLREVLIKIGFNNKDIRHIPKIKNSRTHKNYKSYYTLKYNHLLVQLF